MQACHKFYTRLAKAGCMLQLHNLDNETSNVVEDFITSQSAAIQYLLPVNHHTNAAEYKQIHHATQCSHGLSHATTKQTHPKNGGLIATLFLCS